MPILRTFCFARSAIASSGLLRINMRHARKCTDRYRLDLTGVSNAAVIHMKKYSQEAGTNEPRQFVCYNLPHRTLLKIQGQDTRPFLQGIITNDIEIFEEPDGSNAMYAHMLNVQGRTLYDIMLYRYCKHWTAQFWTYSSMGREWH